MPDPEDAMYKRHYYILESLAVVKSCFLVHDVGDEDLVIALMECLFRAATPRQGRKAIDHMYNIMNVCLDDEVSLPVCATVMQRLVPGGKTTDEARKIARVCLQTNVALQQTCGHLALEIFHGSAAPCVAQLRPKLAAVIEVLMYSNEAMLRIIPGLSAGIEAEDAEVRLSVVAMLGKIYSVESDASDAPLAAGDPALSYAVAHQSGHFKAFLGRFQDVSAHVRSAMCEHGAIIMKAKPAVAAHIEPCFNAVLDDDDARVRDAAVQAVADVGLSSPAAARALEEETVRVLCERVRDRELRVRLHAVVAVGRIYQAASGGSASASTSSASRAASGDTVEEEDGGSGGGDPPRGGLNAWLRHIPFDLLGALRTASKSRDVQMTSRVCRTFDDLVLPSGSAGDAASPAEAVGKRARALLSLYSSSARAPRWLDAAAAANAQAGLDALLCSRKVLQEHTRRFLDARRRVEEAEKAAADARAGRQKAKGETEGQEEEEEEDDDAMDVETRGGAGAEKDRGDDDVRAAKAELAAAQKLLVARTSDPGTRGQSRADVGKLVHALNKMRDKNVFVLLRKVRALCRSSGLVWTLLASTLLDRTHTSLPSSPLSFRHRQLCDPTTPFSAVDALRKSLLRNPSVVASKRKAELVKWLKSLVIGMRMATIDADGLHLIFRALAAGSRGRGGGAASDDGEGSSAEEEDDAEGSDGGDDDAAAARQLKRSALLSPGDICNALALCCAVANHYPALLRSALCGETREAGALRALLSFASSSDGALSLQATRLLCLAAPLLSVPLDGDALRVRKKLSAFCRGSDSGASVDELKGAAQSARVRALVDKAACAAAALCGLASAGMRASEITATIKKASGAKSLSAQNAALPAVLSGLHAFASTRATRTLFARGRGEAVLQFVCAACLDPRSATLFAALASGAPTRRARRSTRRTVSPRAQSCALACALAASSAVALYIDAAGSGGVTDGVAAAALETIRLLVQMVKLCDDDDSARPTSLAALADVEREHIALAATKAAFDAVVQLNTAVTKFGSSATRQRLTSLVCALGESALHSSHADVPRGLAMVASRHAVRKPADAWVLGYCALLATAEDSDQQKAAKRALAQAAKLISKRRARDARAAKNPRALAECVSRFALSLSFSLSFSLSQPPPATDALLTPPQPPHPTHACLVCADTLYCSLSTRSRDWTSSTRCAARHPHSSNARRAPSRRCTKRR